MPAGSGGSVSSPVFAITPVAACERGSPLDHFLAARLLEIDRDAPLAAVHRQEVLREVRVGSVGPGEEADSHPARELAALAGLDLHDVGAEVGQKERRVRALDLLADLDDTNSGERSCHAGRAEYR